jgi:hypothetical protein
LYQEAVVFEDPDEEAHLREGEQNVHQFQQREEREVVVEALPPEVEQEVEEEELRAVEVVPPLEVLEAVFVQLDRLDHEEHDRREEGDVEHQVVDRVADLEARNAHGNAVEEEVNEEDALLE